MSEETESGASIAYSSLLRKLFEVSNIRVESTHLIDRMVDFRETLNVKFAAIRNIPFEIKKEMEVMMENKDLVQFDEDISDNTYDNCKECYDSKVQEQKTNLETQKAVEAVKLEELHNFQKETKLFEENLIQKTMTMSSLQTETANEADLVEELRAFFEELTSTAEMKAKNSEFVQIQNQLQEESSKLNEIIDTKKDINANISKEIAAISEELDGFESQCRHQALDVDKLLCKDNFNESSYKHAESKNHKINHKIEATLQKQENEIAELEMHIANQEEIHESLMKGYNELTDQINSDLGDFASIEEKMVQSENEMAKLNAECDTLNNELDQQSNLKTENEEKLKKFHASLEKLLKLEQKMKDELEKQSQEIQMSQNQDIKPEERSQIGGVMEGSRADEREHVFLQPVIIPLKVQTPRKVKPPRKLKKKRQPPRAIDGPIVQSADSSVSELWQSSIVEVNDAEEQRHYHSLQMIKKLEA